MSGQRVRRGRAAGEDRGGCGRGSGGIRGRPGHRRAPLVPLNHLTTPEWRAGPSCGSSSASSPDWGAQSSAPAATGSSAAPSGASDATLAPWSASVSLISGAGAAGRRARSSTRLPRRTSLAALGARGALPSAQKVPASALTPLAKNKERPRAVGGAPLRYGRDHESSAVSRMCVSFE